MLDATPKSVFDLRLRTRKRNRAVWTSMLAGTGQALDEATLNALYLDTIEGPVAIADEVMAVKEYQRDQQHAISYQQVILSLQEMLDGFGFIQSKLDDLTILWQIKDRIVALKILSSYDLIAETNLVLAAELAGVTQQLTAIQNEQTVLAYELAKNQAELQAETALKQQLVTAKESLQDIQAYSRELVSNLRREMELLVNAAKRAVYNYRHVTHYVNSFTAEWIGKLSG